MSYYTSNKNVALLPPLENFQIRQTMCDRLTVTFSSMAMKDQAIGNPPASFRSAVWKYYDFPAKDGTASKSETICKLILHNQIEIIEVKRQQSKLNQIARNMRGISPHPPLILIKKVIHNQSKQHNCPIKNSKDYMHVYQSCEK